MSEIFSLITVSNVIRSVTNIMRNTHFQNWKKNHLKRVFLGEESGRIFQM